MKAAVIASASQAPIYGDFAAPAAGLGQCVVKVTASAVSHVTKSRASGRHYSAGGSPNFIPGIDGTGVFEGKRVYFLLPESPYGGMAEESLVDESHLFVLPEKLPDDAAAAMAIPGMSSWAALVERAGLLKGETVLVNGATGTSGRLAIQVAKHLGAGRVVATGRNTNSFEELRRLGAEATISLAQDADSLEQELRREFEQGVHVVLDYLWGKSAETVIVAAAKASPDGIPVRFVQIGAASGSDITLPSAALRSSALQLMGSGIGSIPFPKLFKAIKGVLGAAPIAGFEVDTERVPLLEVNAAWSRENSKSRLVLVP